MTADRLPPSPPAFLRGASETVTTTQRYIQRLPMTPVRVQIGDIIREKESLDPTAESYQQRANAIMDKLVKIEGLNLVESRDVVEDDETKNNILCDTFVFRTLLHEPWAQGQPSDDLQVDTDNFLTNRGYEVVLDQPEEGDIVSYREIRGQRILPRTLHFGLYTRGQVTSKFGSSHVFLHDIDTVPESYGDVAVFYRKKPQPSVAA